MRNHYHYWLEMGRCQWLAWRVADVVECGIWLGGGAARVYGRLRPGRTGYGRVGGVLGIAHLAEWLEAGYLYGFNYLIIYGHTDSTVMSFDTNQWEK